MGLVVLGRPETSKIAEFPAWLRPIARGVTELLQSALSEQQKDTDLMAACGWLAHDLGELCATAASLIEAKEFALEEWSPDGPERLNEISRLLRVGVGTFGDRSRDRLLVEANIRDRYHREIERAPRDWITT